MLRLSAQHRRVLIETVPDLANFGAGSLIFGQFLSDRPFCAATALAGVVVWMAMIALVCFLATGERPGDE